MSSSESYSMTNRWWMLLLFFLCQTFSSMTNRGWVICIFSSVCSHHLSSYDHQSVSDTACLPIFPGNLNMFHPMTSRVWVILHFFLQSHHVQVSSHGQQLVSDTTFFSFQAGSSNDQQPVSNTALVFCQAISGSSSFILWPTTNSQWVAWHFSSVRQSHHVLSYDQQKASDTAFSLAWCHHVSSHGQ